MSQLDDLTAGDATPKLARASIKDVALALNRLSYAFKTPDTSVAPDGLQLSSDGNLSLGGIPLSYSTVGRSILVQDVNNATVGAYSSSSNAIIAARTGNTTGGYVALELRKSDDSLFARWRYSPNQGVLKLDINNGGSVSPAVRVNPTGEFTLGDISGIAAKLQIINGVANGGSEGVIYMTSSNPAVIPALIMGAEAGVLQIAGGTNQGARGGQIDFFSGTNSSNAGKIIFRAGTNADGLASGEVGRFTPAGRLSIGLGMDNDPQATLHARTPNGTRPRIIIEGLNDYAGLTARRSNGTYAAPTPIVSGDALLYINAHGYIGNATFFAGPAITAAATENWEAGKGGCAWALNVTPNGTVTQQTAMYWAHNGNVGINNTSPQSKLVVSNANGGNSLEVSPAASVISQLAFDRSSTLYTQMQMVASRHTWNVGASSNAQAMLLETNGTLAINTTVASGGTGATLVDSKVIIGGGAGNSTYLMLQGGAAYAGLKFKSGAAHAVSGGFNNYDITVRPGDSGTGVDSTTDKVLMRFEAAMSTKPRLILQPEGGQQQVIVGDPTNASSNAKFVVVNEPAFNYPALTIFGKDMSNAGALPSADLVIQRDGAVSGVQGMMPWIQLESKSATFAGNNAVAIGGAANNFQIWNFVANNWVQHFTVGPAGLQSNVSALINGGITIRGASAQTGNIVLQSNGALGVAHWISSKTSGFLHIGGNGASEPSPGTMVIASSGRSVALWPTNETQSTYTYAHGGSTAGFHVTNPDTSVNAQAHLFLASGQVNNAGSAVGTISWVLPNLAANGSARLANIGGLTDASHTSGSPSGRIEFATKGISDSTAATRVRIRGTGNVTFGATLNDTSRLYIYNEGRNVDGVTVDMSDNSTGNSSFVSRRLDTTGYAAAFVVNGNIAGAITHPSATTTNYGTGSDHRIKKNVQTAGCAGEIIDRLHVVSHDFIADNYHVPFSFIAQELNEVYPTAVTVGDDGLNITPDSRIWQVDNSKLVPLLVKEVQDLRAKNRDIEAEQASMKTELADLRELVELLLREKK